MSPEASVFDRDSNRLIRRWMPAAIGGWALVVAAACIEVKSGGGADTADTNVDVASDVVGEDLGAEVTTPDTTPSDLSPVDGDEPDLDVPKPECGAAGGCQDRESVVCKGWACEDGRCVEVSLETDNRCSGDNACLDYACNAGSCVATPVEDGTDCDDGLFCNGIDRCKAGQCESGSTCDAIAVREEGCISNYTCNEDERRCVATWKGPTLAEYKAAGFDKDATCTAHDNGAEGLCVAGMCVPTGMVVVPEGVSRMGCNTTGTNDVDPNCQLAETPAHDVWLGTFAVDRTEANWVVWETCVTAQHQSGSGSCQKVGTFQTTAGTTPTTAADREALPVHYLTWGQAHALCDHMGKRLCTEAEWEKAARGGNASAPGAPRNKWPWGNTTPDCTRANYNSVLCPPAVTIAVDSLPSGASAFGALNMAGNVAEWVADGWDVDAYAERNGSQGPVMSPFVGTTARNLRVLRGGDWSSLTDAEITTYRRRSAEPDTTETNIDAWKRGVRCCRALTQEPAEATPPTR